MASQLNAATNTTGLKEITYVAGFDAGWEIDLFGKNRRALEAAKCESDAAIETRRAVLVSVGNSVRSACFEEAHVAWRAMKQLRDEPYDHEFKASRFAGRYILPAFCLFLAGVVGAALVDAANQGERRQTWLKRCDAKGGKPVPLDRAGYCLRKDLFVDIGGGP